MKRHCGNQTFDITELVIQCNADISCEHINILLKYSVVLMYIYIGCVSRSAYEFAECLCVCACFYVCDIRSEYHQKTILSVRPP